MTEEDIVQRGRKQNLCEKYGITDEQLDFKFVEQCNNAKMLERILQVLRSNEVGHFQQLEKATEERLREVAPSSRILLTPQPVSSWNDVKPDQKTELAHMYLDFSSNENDDTYQKLRKEVEDSPREFPAIRNTTKRFSPANETPVKKETTTKSCVPRSYASWNKFNVEKELRLLDRDDELKLNKAIRAKNEEKVLSNKSSVAMGVEEVGAGDAHRQNAAFLERLKGNEFYKSNEVSNAIECYTKSISFSPNADSYNNRAQCYIKLRKYQEAIVDCSEAIRLSPNDQNVMSKAFFRRSTALESLNRHEEAYEAILDALRFDPNSKEIQERVSKLENICKLSHSSTKKVRMAIQEKEVGRCKPLIEEIASKDIYHPFINSSDNAVLSDIGSARNMCRCSGKPPFLAKLRSAETQLMSNRLYLRKIRPKKMLSDKKSPNRSGLVNGEIIEKDTIEDVEKDVVKDKISTLKSNLISSVERGDLESIVKGVSTLHPSQVCDALSSNLNASSLNLFIKALCVHLKEPSSWKTVEEHLVAMAQLPQFRSSLKCLDKATKDALSERIASVEEQGQRVSNVVMLYELNGALPPS